MTATAAAPTTAAIMMVSEVLMAAELPLLVPLPGRLKRRSVVEALGDCDCERVPPDGDTVGVAALLEVTEGDTVSEAERLVQ